MQAFKPKLLIASSGERLDVARAVQRNLHMEFETKVWDQDAFKLSTYPLESLARELDASHFGVFVTTPDDFLWSRDKIHRVPRDNVIFELGMFIGRLGHHRAFVVAPAPLKEITLPSDLGAFTLALYNPERTDGALVAAVGPACDQIRQAIREFGNAVVQEVLRVKAVRLFSEFAPTFERLLDESTSMTVCFIHSRRWREMHHDRIRSFLRRGSTTFTAYLPNLANAHLMQSLREHFDDGPHIPGFVADVYRYFKELKSEFGERIQVELFNLYPTYSFYQFDDRIIVAMYPLSILRTSVPTLEVPQDSSMYDFFAQDIELMGKSRVRVSLEELEELIATNTAPNQVGRKRRMSGKRTTRGEKKRKLRTNDSNS